MARRQAIARACIAALLGLVGTVAMAAPAGAAKVLGSGYRTCSYGSTITFDPPLTPGRGTFAGEGWRRRGHDAGPRHHRVLHRHRDLGSDAHFRRHHQAGGGQGEAGRPQQGRLRGRMPLPGGDAVPDQARGRRWTAASGLLRPSKVAAGTSGFVDDESGNLGFTYGGAAIGSFAGPATLGLFFDAASSSAIMNCESNVPGSVSSVTVDPTRARSRSAEAGPIGPPPPTTDPSTH